MATLVEITVDPGGGGDYTTLSSAASANWGAGNSDFTTSDEYVKCYVESTDNSADTTAFTINQTMDATRYLEILPVVGKEWDTTAAFPSTGGIYRFECTATGNQITISSDYVKLTGICLKGTAASSSDSLINIGNSQTNVTIEGCYIYYLDSSYNYCRAIYTGYSTSSKSGTHYIRNNKFVGNTDGTPPDLYCAVANECTGKTTYIQNNTIVDFGVAVRASNSHVVTPENNCIFGCDDSWHGTMTSARNNGYEEGVDPGTGGVSLSGVAATDLWVSTTDLHVKDTDSALYDAGVDLSGTFTDDIDGVTRSTWDIGAYEYYSPDTATVNFSLDTPDFNAAGQDNYEAAVTLAMSTPDFNMTGLVSTPAVIALSLSTPSFAVTGEPYKDVTQYRVVRRSIDNPKKFMRRRLR